MRTVILIAITLVAYNTAESCGTTPIAPNLYVGNAVIGGGTVSAYSWPWNVAICTADWFGNCDFQLGGTVISPIWVLTSASFVTGRTKREDYRVKSGVFDQSNMKEASEQIAEVTRIVVHPDFDGTHNDIALLQLTTPLRYDQFTQPVCLPLNDDVQTQEGQTAWFTGWGYTRNFELNTPTKQLQQANLYIDSPSECSSYYRTSLWGSELCVGSAHKTTCNFDLGSPLVQQPNNDGIWYQYGISSYSARTCEAAGVFTRVSSFCSWISSETGVNCI